MVNIISRLYNEVMNKTFTAEELKTLVEYFELLIEIDNNNKEQALI